MEIYIIILIFLLTVLLVKRFLYFRFSKTIQCLINFDEHMELELFGTKGLCNCKINKISYRKFYYIYNGFFVHENFKDCPGVNQIEVNNLLLEPIFRDIPIKWNLSIVECKRLKDLYFYLESLKIKSLKPKHFKPEKNLNLKKNDLSFLDADCLGILDEFKKLNRKLNLSTENDQNVLGQILAESLHAYSLKIIENNIYVIKKGCLQISDTIKHDANCIYGRYTEIIRVECKLYGLHLSERDGVIHYRTLQGVIFQKSKDTHTKPGEWTIKFIPGIEIPPEMAKTQMELYSKSLAFYKIST